VQALIREGNVWDPLRWLGGGMGSKSGWDSTRQGLLATCADHEDSDEILIQRYQRGDSKAFERLYQRHRSAVLRFVRRLSPDADDNQEITQETWMAVIRGLGRYRPQARFTTYLFSIAHRRTMDRWRKRGREPLREPAGEGLDALPGPSSNQPESEADVSTLRSDLMKAVAALPFLQREIFLLRAEGGLSLDEIAEVTSTSRETAKSRLRYALSKLRTSLEPWNE
jgi:RNA polymerase sigma-70 factor, ECF subfamily